MPRLRPRVTLPLLLALAAVVAVDPGLAAPPVATMVADIAQVIPGFHDPYAEVETFPRSLPATLGSLTYFYGDDGVHGRELWVSDGTPAGTAMVRDLCPGRCGAASLWSLFSVAPAGQRVLFAADDGVHGQELWVIPAAGADPVLVADLFPGGRGSSPGFFQPVGDRVFFLARDLAEGSQLWVSDGTTGGTFRVADPVPGPSDFYYRATADLGGLLLFGAAGPLGGLWRSDGTAAGTYEISPVTPWQNSWPQGSPFVVFGGRLLFTGGVVGPGMPTLWSSDGTAAGTLEIASLEWPWNFTPCGDVLYFVAGSPRSLYRTAGTPQSTALVPLPPGVRPSGDFGKFACAGSHLVFSAYDDVHGSEPWVATEAGATLLLDLIPGPVSGLGSTPEERWMGSGKFLATLGDRVVFLADDAVHGTEPWITDGTPEGTQLALDSIPGPSGVTTAAITRVLPHPTVGGALLYWERAADRRLRLWRSDGSATDTYLVATLESETSSIPPPAEGLGYSGTPPPSCFAAIGDGLTFVADDGLSGRELWFTSAKSGQTAQVLDLAPGAPGSGPAGCIPFDGRAIFAGVDDRDLWSGQLLALEGASGAVEQLAAGPTPVGGWVSGARFQSQLYLGLGTLWRTSGSAAGTEDLADFASIPIEVASTGDRLFAGADHLFAFDPEGSSFHSLDGDGTDWTHPERLTPLGSRLLYFASDEATGFELWVSDGTVEGTGPVLDLRPGVVSAISEDAYFAGRPSLTRLVPLGPVALFAADDGVHGEELWRTDGSAGGTWMVTDLFPGAYPSTPRELTRVGDFVLFSAEAPGSGRELFASDGTAAGTRRIADLVPGAGSSVPQELAAIREELWFSAWTPEGGREPWRARRLGGNQPDLEPLGDLAPGPLSSSPLIFRAVGPDVYTVANDNLHGFELWKIRDPDLLFADDFESSATALWSLTAP